MSWEDKESPAGNVVVTDGDLKYYTHVYLEVQAAEIARRCKDDVVMNKTTVSVDHLGKWQEQEKLQLHQLCRERGILFSIVGSSKSSAEKASQPSSILDKAAEMLLDFRIHSKEHNLTCAKKALDDILAARSSIPSTMLVIDADKTLADEDAGLLFFKAVAKRTGSAAQDNPLKDLFSSPMGHTYKLFRQASLLVEEARDDEQFEAICEEVMQDIHIRVDIICLLKLVSQYTRVGADLRLTSLRKTRYLFLDLSRPWQQGMLPWDAFDPRTAPLESVEECHTKSATNNNLQAKFSEIYDRSGRGYSTENDDSKVVWGFSPPGTGCEVLLAEGEVENEWHEGILIDRAR